MRILFDGSTVDDSTPVKMIDGQYHLLSAEDLNQQKFDGRSSEIIKVMRNTQDLTTAPIASGGLGSLSDRLDYLRDNGFDAWKAHELAVLTNIAPQTLLFSYSTDGNIYKAGVLVSNYDTFKAQNANFVAKGHYFELAPNGVITMRNGPGRAPKDVIDFINSFYPTLNLTG